jgi:hypothetical protein
MNEHGSASQILIDYVAAIERHGSLDFAEFLELWAAAQALAEEAAAVGYRAEDAADLLRPKT